MSDRTFTVIQAMMELVEHDTFVPTKETETDPDLFYCARLPDIEIGLTTLITYTEWFQEALLLTAEHKLQSIDNKLIDELEWIPAIGHYFTDLTDTLALYRIASETELYWQVVLISGGDEEFENLTDFPKEGFTDEYVWVQFETEEDES